MKTDTSPGHKVKEAFEKITRVEEGRRIKESLSVPISYIDIPSSVGAAYISYSVEFNAASQEKFITVPEIMVYEQDNVDLLTVNLVHELRHAQQLQKKYINPRGRISPLDAAWFNHVLEADARAAEISLILQVKLAGDAGPFDFALKHACYKHMYEEADRLCQENPACVGTPEFKRRIFDSFFDDPVHQKYLGQTTRNFYDRNTLASFKQNDRHFEKWGLKKTPLTLEEVERIGVSGGEEVNYLTLPGYRRLDDPYYKKINNFIARAFLGRMEKSWKRGSGL